MAIPQGWEEIMPICRSKNPPIHKPHDVHRFLNFFKFFFHICNVAEMALTLPFISLMMCIGFFFHICNVAELAFIPNTV